MRPEDVSDIAVDWFFRIAGGFLTFLAGVVTATWVVAGKVRGWEDRITTLESDHDKCQNVVLASINNKLDAIPDKIEEKMEQRFNRVHDRIDKLIGWDKEEKDDA